MNLSRILWVFVLLMFGALVGAAIFNIYDDFKCEPMVNKESPLVPKQNEIKEVLPQPTTQPIKYLNRVDQWTCYDYSVEFNKQNPEWGLVVLSDKMSFQGECHIVNYRINEDKILTLHDEWNQIEYNYTGWELTDDICSPDHFHFFHSGELPRRSWRMLRPNAGAVYDAL